jgi:hypothetical protein
MDWWGKEGRKETWDDGMGFDMVMDWWIGKEMGRKGMGRKEGWQGLANHTS